MDGDEVIFVTDIACFVGMDGKTVYAIVFNLVVFEPFFHVSVVIFVDFGTSDQSCIRVHEAV